MPRSLIVRRSNIHGRGVFAAHDLPARTTLIRYRGRLLTHGQADALYAGGAETGHTFLFTLNEHYVIDGNDGGNSARWINHGCAPNCEAVCVASRKGDPARDRIEIETLRPVAAGEELTYDYGIVLEQRHSPRLKRVWACRCGVAGCSGTMLKAKRKR